MEYQNGYFVGVGVGVPVDVLATEVVFDTVGVGVGVIVNVGDIPVSVGVTERSVGVAVGVVPVMVGVNVFPLTIILTQICELPGRTPNLPPEVFASFQ